MKLDAWLKQGHPLEDRLLVIERLCQAVNEIHDRGDVVGGLEPGRIALGAEGQCDLSGARKRTPRPPYAPPEGDQSSPNLADIYAAGAISWEILAGRTPGGSPAHLTKVRPDLQRELADAVMACVEKSPDWRPNDLTYLAQMAAARQRAAAGPARASRAPLPPRATPKPVRRRGPSRRTWPLLVALVVVLGLAALAGRQYLGGIVGLFQPDATRASSAPERPASAPRAAATPEPTPPAPRRQRPPKPTPAVETGTAPAVADAPPEDLPPGASHPAAEEKPPEPATPTTTPEVAVAAAPPATATAVPPPVTPSSAPADAPAAAPAAPPPVAEVQPTPPPVPLPPAVLKAIAPPSVKRPGKVLVDLRGTGLGAHHRARILPVKKVPWGIKVVRQKHVSDALITILLELEDSAEPGEYAIAVEDGRGGRSEPLVFEVTK